MGRSQARLVMRVVKALAILLLGPLSGIFIGFFLGALALPPDPNFVPNGGHAAPGDGFLTLPLILVSLLISVPTSIFLAGAVLFGKAKSRSGTEDQIPTEGAN